MDTNVLMLVFMLSSLYLSLDLLTPIFMGVEHRRTPSKDLAISQIVQWERERDRKSVTVIHLTFTFMFQVSVFKIFSSVDCWQKMHFLIKKYFEYIEFWVSYIEESASLIHFIKLPFIHTTKEKMATIDEKYVQQHTKRYEQIHKSFLALQYVNAPETRLNVKIQK